MRVFPLKSWLIERIFQRGRPKWGGGLCAAWEVLFEQVLPNWAATRGALSTGKTHAMKRRDFITLGKLLVTRAVATSAVIVCFIGMPYFRLVNQNHMPRSQAHQGVVDIQT